MLPVIVRRRAVCSLSAYSGGHYLAYIDGQYDASGRYRVVP